MDPTRLNRLSPGRREAVRDGGVTPVRGESGERFHPLKGHVGKGGPLGGLQGWLMRGGEKIRYRRKRFSAVHAASGSFAGLAAKVGSRLRSDSLKTTPVEVVGTRPPAPRRGPVEYHGDVEADNITRGPEHPRQAAHLAVRERRVSCA